MEILDAGGNRVFMIGRDIFYSRAAALHFLWLRDQLKKAKK